MNPTSWVCRCPECHTALWRRRGGEMTLDCAILKLDADNAVVVRCPTSGCAGVAPVPFLQVVEPPQDSPRRRRLRQRLRSRSPAVPLDTPPET